MTLPSKPGYTVGYSNAGNGATGAPNTQPPVKARPFENAPFASAHPPSMPGYATEYGFSMYNTPAQSAPLSDNAFGFRSQPPPGAGGPASGMTPTNMDMERGLLTDIAALDQITAEELQEKKRRTQEHPYHLLLLQALTELTKLSPFPPHQFHPPPGSLDFGLASFLQSQGIEADEKKATGPNADPQYTEFMSKFTQLRQRYEVELSKLNRVCSEFCNRLMNTLKEQRVFRFVSDIEINLKVGTIQQRFDYVRSQLRQNVCNAIVLLQRQYNQVKKTRRSLSKKATEVLTQWFFEHINDPYPSDEEKAMLATQCSLTLNQVNNWFGNKRIRYKRKCLEEEAKRAKDMSGPMPSGAGMPKHPAQAALPPSGMAPSAFMASHPGMGHHPMGPGGPNPMAYTAGMPAMAMMHH